MTDLTTGLPALPDWRSRWKVERTNRMEKVWNEVTHQHDTVYYGYQVVIEHVANLESVLMSNTDYLKWLREGHINESGPVFKDHKSWEQLLAAAEKDARYDVYTGRNYEVIPSTVRVEWRPGSKGKEQYLWYVVMGWTFSGEYQGFNVLDEEHILEAAEKVMERRDRLVKLSQAENALLGAYPPKTIVGKDTK